MTDLLLIDQDQRGVATVTLNRPDVHNAFNAALIDALHKTFKTLGADENCRVIVLRAAGKSFSAGADLSWMKEAAGWSAAQNQADAEHLSGMLDAIAHCAKPVIALVQGAAMGGGVGLVACADIAIAAAEAKFALSEVRLGLIPATISPYVVAAIGPRQAGRYFLTAERFDAVTAKQIGLVHEVAEDAAALTAKAEELIGHLLAGGPEALTGAKYLIRDVVYEPIDAALKTDTAKRIAHHRTSAEGQEGLAAFFDKRKAKWVPDA